MAASSHQAWELEDWGCAHRGRNQRFGPRAKRVLLVEAQDADGVSRCMYPGCWAWDDLRFHHIHPSWANGRNTPDNGIVQCPNHHAAADNGLISPSELRYFKLLRARSLPAIKSRSQVEQLIETSSSPESPQGARCDWAYFSSLDRLKDLRRAVPSTSQMLYSVRRAFAATQLRMAGALCAWLPADLVTRSESERFEIDLHARHALSIAHRLNDPELAMRARHTLAVNANAQHDFACARTHSLASDKLRSGLVITDPAYHAYLTRDLAAILARCRDFPRSYALIAESTQIARTAGASDGAETWMRMAEVLIFAGDVAAAGRLIEADACRDVVLTPIQTVIRIRIQSAFESLTGRPAAAAVGLQNALAKAGQHALGHQRAKISAALLHLSNATLDS